MHKEVHYLLHLLNTCRNMSFDFVRLLLCYRAEEEPEGRREVCLVLYFKMNVIKWKLHFVFCNFGLKSNLWLQIVITRLISDQIALHSVQLPLFITFILKSMVFPAIWLTKNSAMDSQSALFGIINRIIIKPIVFECSPKSTKHMTKGFFKIHQTNKQISIKFVYGW